MPRELYSEKDAPENFLKQRHCVILGYGSQGRAQALNLKDGGYSVAVSLPEGSNSIARARQEGFKVLSNQEAVAQADILVMALPDMAQPAIYHTHILPMLQEGQALVFCHALAVREGWIEPPSTIPTALVAPLGPGDSLRERYGSKSPLPCLLAAWQEDAEALKVALAYAQAIGSLRARCFKTTFEEECVLDLFCEQAVLCGGVSALVQEAFHALTKAGYPSTLAYFSCLQELALTVELMRKHGIAGMLERVSDTAAFGAREAIGLLKTQPLEKAFEKLLSSIESGHFADTWSGIYQKGGLELKNFLTEEKNTALQSTHENLREQGQAW